MAVSITLPYPAPTNIVPTVNAGGSLDANTTYYFRILASNNGATYNLHAREGVASAEQSFTTTATDRQVTITWDAVPGAGGYHVYLTKTSGDYASNKSHVGGDYSYSTTTNSITISSENLYDPRHLFTYPGTLPNGLDKNIGKALINFTGTTTLQDIKDEMDAQGLANACFYDGGVFELIGCIYLTGTTAASLTEKNKTIIFINGGIRVDNPNATLTFGDYDASTRRGYNGCTIYGLQYGNRTGGYSYGCKFYGCTLKGEWGGVTKLNKVINADSYCRLNYSSTSFNGARIETMFNTYADCSDVEVAGDGYRFSALDPCTITRPIIKNAYFQDELYGDSGTLLVVEGKIWGHWEGDLRCSRYSGNGDSIFRDCVFERRGDNIPRVYWQSSYTNPFKIQFTLDLTVVDRDNNPIEGAKVKIEDVNGDEVSGSPFTTDANGNISQVLLSWIMTNPGGGTYYNSTNRTDYTPFTITISKTGYVTKKVIYPMNKKTVEREVLESRREV